MAQVNKDEHGIGTMVRGQRYLLMQKRTMNSDTFDKIKDVGDGVAVVVTVGAVTSLLPAVAALFTIIWTGIRIIETDTIKGLIAWIKRRLA